MACRDDFEKCLSWDSSTLFSVGWVSLIRIESLMQLFPKIYVSKACIFLDSLNTHSLYKPFDKLRKAVSHDYMNKSIQSDYDYFIFSITISSRPSSPSSHPLHPVTSRVFGMIIWTKISRMILILTLICMFPNFDADCNHRGALKSIPSHLNQNIERWKQQFLSLLRWSQLSLGTSGWLAWRGKNCF